MADSTPATVQVGASPLWLAPAAFPGHASGASHASGAAASGNTAASDPAQVRVQVFGHSAAKAAGINGVLVRLTRADGSAEPGPVVMSLDYNGFSGAYGGNWADRLQLIELTGCVATSPVPVGCHMRRLAYRNNTETGTLEAVVQVSGPGVVLGNAALTPKTSLSASGGVLVAATAAPSGTAGSFGATSLQASGSWSVGGSSGDFQWSYPLRTPPALGGPAPSLALSYDSAAVDGQMATSNNQPSWIGEGFDMTTGFIERSYKACADDMGGNANNTTSTGDNCWATGNATLTLAGHNGELIQDANDPNRWHLRHDDGTYIRHVTGASNGAHDGEYWVVTTPDGTQYWFGKSANGNDSAWTEPVYGNNPGEPCHAATFAASSCTQAYRWNLDHVVDPSGNTMDFYYTTETNMYAADDNPNSPVSYIRGGFLNKITYGTRTGSTGNAPMQVVFTTGDRCVTSSCGTHDATNWPDTPWDQQCTGAPCFIGSPTFWIDDRLATIQTQLYSGTGSTYNPVTTWTLTHTMPDPGDGTDAGLWLSSIVQTGQDGSPSISLPPVTFVPVQLNNRVDTLGDSLPPMNWMRMASITTDSGSEVTVSYNPSTCAAGSSMPDPAHLENNTLTCYPVIWTPPGDTSPITDFFNKYTVAQVDTTDLTTPGNPATVTTYKYIGNPAWHFTDSTGIVPDKQRTWSVWRGYPTVETDTGIGAGEQVTHTTYFQGMNGDHLPNGTRSVVLPAVDMNENGSTTDSTDSPAVADDDAFAGMVRETTVYNGPGGAEVSATVNDPWESAPTASTTNNGITISARFVGIQGTHTRTDLDGGRAPRTTSTSTVFDAMGYPVQQQDNGDDAVTGDEKCTLTSYARNMASDGSTWLVNFPYQAEVTATTCATALAGGLTSAQVISDNLSYYDGATTASTPPTTGLVTRTDQLKDWVNSAPVYLTTALDSYDANGRVVSATDVRGNTTTTAYATNAGGQLATTTSTTQLGWVTTTTVDPATGSTVHVVDPNGRITDESYDALGRLIAVWKPGRDKSAQSPNLTYSYLIRNNAPNVVTTSTLTPSGGYISSYQLYDGLLRQRQTQAPRGDGAAGALVSDTFYDTAGRAYLTNSQYLAAITPGTTLFVANQQNVPQQTQITFDGAGRNIRSVVYNLNSQGVSVPFATTSTSYGGDRADVTPPTGGIATSSIVDARGNVVALRQYHGPAPTPNTPGSYDTTSYAYNAKNQLITVTDPAGNHWQTSYDVRGRVIQTSDPDAGTTTTTYDDAGDVMSISDARGVTLNYTYDSIGRKTALYNGAINSADQLAAWTYDGLSNSRGQLTKSTSYDGGNAYTTTINGFTADYQASSITYTIPAGETGLAGSYTYVYTYNGDGSPATTRLPDIDGSGGLTQETLTQQYNSLGQVSGLQTSIPTATSLVPSISYTGYGELAVLTLQTNGGNQAYQAYTYDSSNRRLIEQSITKQTSPAAVADFHYSYDPSGNLLEASDSVSGDNQCYSYDYLDRLSSAWSPANGDCTAAKSVAALGGPAPYWEDWSFNAAGTRTTQVAHDTPNGVAMTSYTVPAPGAAQPHAITKASTTDSTGTRTGTYGYDAAGDTIGRPSPNGTANQTLTYNPQGHLASVTDNGATSTYTYDVDGSQLIERDATGKTLFLPGQELRYTAATGAKATTRYYSAAGQVIAMRTASGVTWMMADRQGTANITIDNVTQAVAQRRQDPYGNPRGSTSGAWPAADTKGYLNGNKAGDGLTHLGAREYDAAIGRFTTADPIRPTGTPQRYDAYAYCANNPIGATDPTGTSSSSDEGWYFQFAVGPFAWNSGGYHFQETDLIFFWCRDQGTQCLGGILYYNGEWLDQNYQLTKNKVEWWIPMSDIGTLNQYGFIPIFDALRVRYVTVTPLVPPPPPCTNLPANYTPAFMGPAPPGTQPPPVDSGMSATEAANCSAFFSFWIFGSCGAGDWWQMHGEDVAKWTVGGLIAAGCLAGTFGTGGGGCIAAGIAAGTAFNIYDYVNAGGPSSQSNVNNFWLNEGLDAGAGYLLPSSLEGDYSFNQLLASQATGLAVTSPQSPIVPFMTGGNYSPVWNWSSTNQVDNGIGAFSGAVGNRFQQVPWGRIYGN